MWTEDEREGAMSIWDDLLDWGVKMLSNAWIHFVAGFWFDFFMFSLSAADNLCHAARIRAQRFIYSTINSTHSAYDFELGFSVRLLHVWFGSSLLKVVLKPKTCKFGWKFIYILLLNWLFVISTQNLVYYDHSIFFFFWTTLSFVC